MIREKGRGRVSGVPGQEERALPATNGARERGASNRARGCGGRAQPAPRSDEELSR
jgi:hypothetical protein